MQAAKYLGCTVWEMKRQPAWYEEHAIAALSAENRVADAMRKEAGKRKR